jgi:hypothetical protein
MVEFEKKVAGTNRRGGIASTQRAPTEGLFAARLCACWFCGGVPFPGSRLPGRSSSRHPWPSPVGSLRERPPRSSSRRLSDTPHHHSQRCTLPSTNAATAAAKLLKVESPTAFHHSACAPTLSTRGHSRMYFGRLETDNPANASGTTIHRATPSIDTNAAATSSQYSGARHQQRVLLFLALP